VELAEVFGDGFDVLEAPVLIPVHLDVGVEDGDEVTVAGDDGTDATDADVVEFITEGGEGLSVGVFGEHCEAD